MVLAEHLRIPYRYFEEEGLQLIGSGGFSHVYAGWWEVRRRRPSPRVALAHARLLSLGGVGVAACAAQPGACCGAACSSYLVVKRQTRWWNATSTSNQALLGAPLAAPPLLPLPPSRPP